MKVLIIVKAVFGFLSLEVVNYKVVKMSKALPEKVCEQIAEKYNQRGGFDHAYCEDFE